MSSPTHYRVEVFYETLDGPACGYQAPGQLTDDPSEVTCRECRTLCGFDEIEPARHVLTARVINEQPRRAA